MAITDEEVDTMMARVGGFNRWQMMNFFVISTFVTMSYCWTVMVLVFIGAEPPHFCNPTDNTTFDYTNITIPWTNISQVLPACSTNASDEEAVCTSGWTYDESYGSTVVTEWDLICDRSYLTSLSNSLVMTGVMIGGLIFSSIADTFGRKPILIACILSTSLINFSAAFTQHFVSFVILRVLSGAFATGSVTTGFVLSVEVFSANYRSHAGIAFNYFWITGLLLLTFFSYFVRDWRHMLFIISLPGCTGILMIWIVSRSIPWLIANNQVKEANAILKRAFRMNRRPVNYFPEDEVTQMAEEDKNADLKCHSCAADDHKKTTFKLMRLKNYAGSLLTNRRNKDSETLLSIFKSRPMIVSFTISMFIWFVNALVYWGLTLSTGTLFEGDRFVNFLLSTVAELLGYIFATIAIRFSRRWTLFSFQGAAGAFLLATAFIPRGQTSILSTLTTIMGALGKLAITTSYSIVIVYTSELFPTNIRTVTYASCLTISRIGSILAPFAAHVMKYVKWLPGVLFGTFAIVAGGVVLLLPETLGRPLPETIGDVERWSKTKVKKRKAFVFEDEMR